VLNRIIIQNQLTVGVVLMDRDGHFHLGVIVDNNRPTPVDVLVEKFAIWSATDPKAKPIQPLPPSKVVPKLYYKGIEDYVAWLNKVTLADSTVGPGHRSIAGTVFFPRENKKHTDVVVYLPIGGDRFEFEMSPQFQ